MVLLISFFCYDYHFKSKYCKSALGSHPGACDAFRSGAVGSWLGLDTVVRTEASDGSHMLVLKEDRTDLPLSIV